MPDNHTTAKCDICDGTEEVKPWEKTAEDDPTLMCVYCWAQLMAGDDDGVLDRQVRNGCVKPPAGWPFRDDKGRFRTPRDSYP